jgi:hypothetical protein
MSWCGQSAGRWPYDSQSSQYSSDDDVADDTEDTDDWRDSDTACGRCPLAGASSFSRSQLKRSCPGCSQISHRPSLGISDELTLLRDAVLVVLKRSLSVSVGVLDAFLYRAVFSLSRSISCSSSSSR